MIKSFKLFESHSEIIETCKEYGIENYSINEDESIDVNDNVFLDRCGLSKLPLKFGRVSGYFYCSYNQLTSLEFAPNHVGGSFYCENNQLTSLEFSPSYVGGYFDCQYNQLTSLEFSPSYVGDGFYCGGNPIFEIYYLFKTPKCIEFINEYDVIQGKSIVLSRLEEVYHDLGIEIPNEFNFKYYKLIE